MEENTVYRIVSATGIPRLDDDIEAYQQFSLLGRCNLKSEIAEVVEVSDPDVLIVSDHISGEENLAKLLLEIKNRFPHVRIVYFAGELMQRDTKRRDMLGMLVMVGIYDIVLGRTLNRDVAIDAIIHPRAYEAVEFLTRNLIDSKAEVYNAFAGLSYEEVDELEELDKDNNVYVFTSVKPGTGKSFSAINAACAVAKYGEGRPRVALIDADLQTLSVGTTLGMQDDPKKNIKTCMEAIAGIFDNGKLIDDEEKIKRTKRIMKDCFVRYSKIPNLDVLIGSSLTPEEVDALNIKPEYYTYLVETIREDYEIVIVDLNSNIFHVTSFGILRMCKTAYYIVNLDFNNIRNNVRYKNMLDEIDISRKVKYVLNQAIENTEFYDYLGVADKPLIFTPDDMEKKSEINIFKKIPYISPVIAYNNAYNGLPAILDTEEAMDRVRFAILDLANDIYPMGSEYERLRRIIEADKESTYLEAFKAMFGGHGLKKDKKTKIEAEPIDEDNASPEMEDTRKRSFKLKKTKEHRKLFDKKKKPEADKEAFYDSEDHVFEDNDEN